MLYLIIAVAILAFLAYGFIMTIIDAHVDNLMKIRAAELDALAEEARINTTK